MKNKSFLHPINFRNSMKIKRVIKDFGIQGYGIVLYLLETLAETENHIYTYNDIDLIADDLKIQKDIIQSIIETSSLFETTIDENNDVVFFSHLLNQWLEPYYNKIEQCKKAGRISAEKRKMMYATKDAL